MDDFKNKSNFGGVESQGSIKGSEVTPKMIAQEGTRYLIHLSNLMMVVKDFHDGLTSQPDPPHSHPHEQISYLVSGEINFVLVEEVARLGPGDILQCHPTNRTVSSC
jgi:quercetin dioxygenase-like cupin family protein